MIILTVYFLNSIIYKLTKNKKPFKRAFLVMLCGITALCAVDVLSVLTGVYLPVSPLSVTVSACMGVPGVASMLMLGWVL